MTDTPDIDLTAPDIDLTDWAGDVDLTGRSPMDLDGYLTRSVEDPASDTSPWAWSLGAALPQPVNPDISEILALQDHEPLTPTRSAHLVGWPRLALVASITAAVIASLIS